MKHKELLQQRIADERNAVMECFGGEERKNPPTPAGVKLPVSPPGGRRVIMFAAAFLSAATPSSMPNNLTNFPYPFDDASKRLQDVIIENKDCLDIIRERDGPDSLIYCDPPYFDAESLYAVDFPKEKHEELHRILSQCKGYIVVSYNDCPFIRSLYGDFFISSHSAATIPSHREAGATYDELIITNYDPRPYIQPQFSMFPAEIENGDLVLVHEPTCGSLREIYLRRRNHETDKNDAPAGAGGEAGNGREMSPGSNGPNDGDGDRSAQYPPGQPPDERYGMLVLRKALKNESLHGGTVLCEGKAYYDVGGQLCHYPKFEPDRRYFEVEALPPRGKLVSMESGDSAAQSSGAGAGCGGVFQTKNWLSRRSGVQERRDDQRC